MNPSRWSQLSTQEEESSAPRGSAPKDSLINSPSPLKLETGEQLGCLTTGMVYNLRVLEAALAPSPPVPAWG